MGKKKTFEIQGKEVPLSKPDKQIYPGNGITKADIVDYYRRICAGTLHHGNIERQKERTCFY
jgi:bifunctional non-homologous end joining protein LigD